MVSQKTRNSCTGAQRGYYWPVIVGMIAERSNKPGPVIHGILKSQFLKRRVELVPGVSFEFVGSTESLDTAEREDFHTKCRKWAWDNLKLSIPLPNENEVNG